MGENLINTSRQSSLYGENSTLTGDNISKEELNHLINTQADKIQARNNKQQEIDRTTTNISANQLDQDTIRRRIELLKEANREATRKVDQLQELNNQKSTKEHELETLRQALESAKAEATNQSTHTDRTVWSNFENQLRSLNWDKLTETNGVDQLANELKAKVENDFPTITKYDVEKYKPLINGYVNSKGIFGKNRDIVEYEISGFFPRERGYEDKINNLMNTLINETNHQNKLIHTVNDIQPTKYLKSPITNQESIQRYLTYNQFLKNDDVKEFIGEYTESNDYGYGYEEVYSFPNTASEHYSHNMDNGIYGNQGLLRDSYHPLIQDVTLNVESLISTPMLKNKKEIYSFINHVNTVLRFSLSDFKNKEVISPADIAQLDNAFNAFKNLKNEINWDAEQSSWTIDKNEYKSKIDNLEPFFAKIKDYIDSYNANLNDPSNNQKKADMLKKYNALLNEDNNIIANQKLTEANLSQKGQELLEKFNRIASESNDKAVAEMNDMIDKLKLFDRNHQIVREVNEKVTELTNKIQSKEREIAEKQAELNTINTSISNNALTEEERNANTLREEKERELAEKQREKEQLEQEKATKERELEELNRAIQSGNLTNKGLQNIGIGYNNFNSGAKAITIGNENTVLADGAVAIGNNNNLSKEATNTFVLGSNVTTNIPNSVALGKDTTLSAPIATPSHTIAGTQYNFAGIAPVGTVSIGAEGKERTLTNLAAGRISNTSTDGINGSQLNAVIETLNGLSTELTTLKNAPKTKAPVIKAGDGLSLTEGDDGSITLSNALTFNSGDGINVNKEGNNITITNTQPLSAEDKTKYDTASTNASSALEKANANEGKINDLTSRVTVNDGNITALTGKVTTVTNTANEALGKANTAVQPDKLKAGDGISVVKGENGDITITNTKSFNNDDKEKLNTAFDKSSTAVQPDSLEAGNGISISKADGKITITNTQPLTTEDKAKYDNASTKAENAIQLDKLKVGNGISVNKAENGEITITNTKAFEDADKERLNTALTTANNALEKANANEGKIDGLTGKINAVTETANNAQSTANSALEKANANEGAINIANGKITANEGKITTQEGKINDLTSRVTANEGNISTLTGKVTTVTNTANEALGKANTNTETINNVSGVANEALGKANTAVQPDKLKAGDGISVNQAENGEITITNTRESGNGLADLTIEGKDNITVNKDGNKYVIGSKAFPSTGNTLPKLAVAGDKNIDATIDDNNNVSLKLKDNLDVQNVQARTINSKNVVTDNLNTGNLNAKNVNAEKLIIGGNELGTKGLTVGDININENGIDAGNKPINNVADGEISPNSQQAINGRQLYPIVNQLDIQRQHIQNLDDRVGRVEQGLHKQNTLRKAGNASAMATAGLLQPHKSGQSGITAAIGQYQGQTAVAVGYSALSDNGKYGVKFSLNTNTQKEMGGSAGVGYFW